MRDLRRQYSQRGLIESELQDDPLEQLRIWFSEAMQSAEYDWQEPNAAILATSTSDGYVTARVILLKGIDEGGLVFFTNYNSLKGQQLAENPRAAVVIFWPHVERQVRVEGQVSKIARTASEEYFHTRPRGSQISAVISTQSSVIADRAELERRAAALQRQLGDHPVPMPDNWGGYCLDPNRLEFWQGRENRLHDRVCYRLHQTEWLKERLSP